jgi:mRNA-degrading endonuclease RelE of RelBE toxin-antitoxin system
VNHFTSPSFWKEYEKLPKHIQELADKNFEILKENPMHPSLHLKKVGNYWSVRVGKKHRAVAIEMEEGLLWFWIGTHAGYDKLLK